MMLFFWILIGFGIFYLLKDRAGVNLKLDQRTGSEEILKQRFVNGEIDEETYLKMLKTIRN